MKLPIYQIDAFANQPFEGNPAAVCPLDKWLPDDVMQSIAEENNLAETAFFVEKDKGFHIRWFTPVAEVDLCGHATLASAYVIYKHLGHQEKEISFESKSGTLLATSNRDVLTLDFPSQHPEPCDCPQELVEALGKKPLFCMKSMDYIAVFENEADVISLQPEWERLLRLDLRGVIVTSASQTFDFVARFFAPKYGINEDPVTGSAYTQLIPYWSNELKKTTLHAKQMSKRGGEVFCEYLQDRVNISGKAMEYLKGEINIKS